MYHLSPPLTKCHVGCQEKPILNFFGCQTKNVFVSLKANCLPDDVQIDSQLQRVRPLERMENIGGGMAAPLKSSPPLTKSHVCCQEKPILNFFGHQTKKVFVSLKPN